MNNKGSIVDPIVWLIVAFITITFLGFMVFSFGEIYDGLMSSNSDLIQESTEATMGHVNSSIGPGLHTLAFVIIFMSGISIFIHNFLVKAHPVFFITYILMGIGAIIASAYLSNHYMNLLTNEAIGSTFQEFTAANFIMQWLPVFTAIISIFGGVFLFIGIIRTDRGGVV